MQKPVNDLVKLTKREGEGGTEKGAVRLVIPQTSLFIEGGSTDTHVHMYTTVLLGVHSMSVYLAQGATHSYWKQLQGTDNSCSRTGHGNRSPPANTRSTCTLFGFKDMDLHYLRSGPSVTTRPCSLSVSYFQPSFPSPHISPLLSSPLFSLP